MGENFATYMGIAAWLVVYIFGYKLMDKLDLLTPNGKKIKIAEKRGNVVTAYYIQGSKSFADVDNGNGTSYRRYYSSYKYQVDGKEYIKKGHVSNGTPPASITLYYVDDPAKAFRRSETTDKRFLRKIVPIVLVVLAFLAAAKVYNLFV